MLRKVFRYIGIFLLTLSVGFYMYFAYRLEKDGRSKETCRKVKVEILDEEVNRFVSEEEVLSILKEEFGELKGRHLSSLNLDLMERTLNSKSAIRNSAIYSCPDGRVCVEITQRRPILRIFSENGSFFADPTGYLFPHAKDFTSFVPVLSGDLGLKLEKDFRGRCSGSDSIQVMKALNVARYLMENPFWGAQIEQLHVDRNRDLLLIPRIGNQTIVFGDFEDIERKFDKLNAFYKAVVPNEGWEKYSIVNVKYRNQIICK